MNTLARQAFESAIKRNKHRVGQPLATSVASIQEELDELAQSDPSKPSPHIPMYTETEEELADILIACMTELYARGVPVLNIIRKKINFNRGRK
jgi:NTP pyrophosphatase (non-canonical NTP hydrolase)